MTKDIIKRVIDEADYMILTNKTIREVAKKFYVSKSTVHKDLRERLLLIDIKRYNNVKEILKNHIEIRHINGGKKTKQIFLEKRRLNV